MKTKQSTSLRVRGFGPDGGGWSVAQASTWSGFSERELRELVKRRLDGDLTIFPCHVIGRRRRIVIPRQAFMDWFSGRSRAA